MRGFLIAGPASGVGKTTVSLAIAAGLRARGLKVQAFKCGPDFLDTGHLSAVTGRPARNLDGWMLAPATIRAAFGEASQDVDVAIVEAMMGLFDGISGHGERGSAAEIAKLLSLPIILVVDASKSARSIAAVIRGFEMFDLELRFAGVVLNGVAGERHYRLLADAITANCGTRILGWLPQERTVHIPERHLGLHTSDEIDWNEKSSAFSKLAESQLDLSFLSAPKFELPKDTISTAVVKRDQRVRIGIPRDEAFCFYYQDNLDQLERAGAKLVPFSPLRDAHLPVGLDGIYLGGGYPELYAGQLGANETLARELREFAASGCPIYAECGGMMYLGKQIRTRHGQAYSMTGVLPIETEMTEKLVRFGYVEIEFQSDCPLGSKGTVLRGHSFHHSQCSAMGELPAAFEARYTLSGDTVPEGFARGNVLASYIHLHFRSAQGVAERFVDIAEGVAKRRPTEEVR